MTTKQKHTPPPWNYEPIFRNITSQIGYVIASCKNTDYADFREANAAYIVKCVNLHDGLVTLLEGVVLDYEGDTDIGFDQRIIDIKAALDLAKS